MELAGDSKESRPRRFPDPLPPPHGHINQAAQRREELLWELHKEHIRQDILLRELAETERAMAARFGTAGHWPMQAPQPSEDYWHQRRPPWLPPWDEAAPRPPPPRAGTGHPPCCPYGSPAAARPPPMYPHVERSPSPAPQPRPADDGEQQQEGEPSAAATERPMLRGDAEACQSPSKGTLPEGALVPDVGNAGAVTMLCTTSFATPGKQMGVGGEPKHDVADGHGVQPLHESGEQSSEQRKTAESTIKDQKDELVARLGQDSPAGLENRTSDEQKQTGFREPTTQAEETSAGLKRMLTEMTSPVGGKPHDVEDGHGVQPLYGSGEQSNEQSAVESTVKDWRDKLVARLGQDSPGGQKNGTSNEQKQTGFREPTPQAEETSAGVKMMLTASTSPVGGEPKHDVEDGHAVQPLHGSGEKSSEQRTTEATVKDWRDELVAQPCQYSPICDQENGNSGEQKQTGFREPTLQAEETFSGVKRKLTVETSPVAKKQKWDCDLCQVSTTGPRNLVEHWAGKMHVAKMQARIRDMTSVAAPEPPPSRRNASVAGNGGPSRREKRHAGGSPARPAEDGDREPASAKWTCNICDAKCYSASTLQQHLGGRRHRVKTEAILAEHKGCYSRKDAEPGKNTYWYCCNVCDAHCNGDTMLASHLVGRRHRETLQGR